MKLSTSTPTYFLEIPREKSFSQAADKLEKFQSALSTQIALLEKDLGVKLFDRSKRPLLMTEAGQLFHEFAKDVLNRSQDFERYIVQSSPMRLNSPKKSRDFHTLTRTSPFDARSK